MTIASITALATSAEARPKHRHKAQVHTQVQSRDHSQVRFGAPSGAQVVCNMQGCSDNQTAARNARAGGRNQVAQDRRSRRQARAEANAAMASVDANGNSVILGGRPSGCPHAFCGCEASLYVFGEIRKDLNLASNWIRKFPRTQAAPGMVAARSGHVFVLMSQVDGKEWLVHDGNSGGGKTRRHVRSIAGYVIVDPHGSRVASN